MPGNDGHYVRMSHLGRARSKKLKEERFAHFLGAPQQASLDRHQFSKSVNHNGAITIDGIIRSEKSDTHFKQWMVYDYLSLIKEQPHGR